MIGRTVNHQFRDRKGRRRDGISKRNLPRFIRITSGSPVEILYAATGSKCSLNSNNQHHNNVNIAIVGNVDTWDAMFHLH